MRLALMALCLTAAGSTLASAADRPRTVAFGGAAFTLPGGGTEPKPRSTAVSFGPQPDQVMAVETQRWELRDVAYTLTVTRLPERLAGAKPATLLAGLKRGLLGPAGTGGELESERALEVSGYPGLALAIRAGKQRVRARVAVAHGVMAQLTAVGVERAVSAGSVAAALDSLSLTEVDRGPH